MCMTELELKALSNETLVENFQRAVQLDAKSASNGKSPFDQDQLKVELLKRLRQTPQ
jgi:hypothetical protein